MTHISAALRSCTNLIPVCFAAAAVCAAPAFSQETPAPETALPAGESALGDMGGSAPAPDGIQTVNPPAASTIPKIDPIALYGETALFDVYRKGEKIGVHKAEFERRGDDLVITSQMDLAVDVLFFTAYRFEYYSNEIWRDNQMLAVAATVNDNGKIAKTNARMEDGVLKVDGPRGTYLASSWVFPTNHWHRGQANSGTILNTLNGRLNKVEVVHKGIDRVETAQGVVEADHLAYTGDLRDTDVWYDAENRWVKMTFKAKDGSVIEYRCKQCGLAPGVPATLASETSPATPEPAATQQEAVDTVQQ